MVHLASVHVSGGVQHTGGSCTDRLCAEVWLETGEGLAVEVELGGKTHKAEEGRWERRFIHGRAERRKGEKGGG